MIDIKISPGELIDKITILMIKKLHTSEVDKELSELIEVAEKHNILDENYVEDLFSVNLKLWKIEDALRLHERDLIFDDKFIELARSVYKLNDERFKIKSDINLELNSDLKEIKEVF